MKNIKENWKPGLTVALVSIPLSVSIAVASGASPVAGIITAVWAGLVAAFFASSNYNIMGPAGALTAILAAAALQFGPGALPSLAILSGVFILIAWAFKLDKYITYIPAPVVHGFTVSVAIILAFGQLASAFGIQNLPQHAHFLGKAMEIIRNLDKADPITTGFFIFCLGFMFLLLRYFKKLPGAIILAPIAILIGYLGKTGAIPFGFVTLGDVYPRLDLSIFSLQSIQLSYDFLVPVLTIALVAILETALSAKIADTLTGTKHDRRKEIFGLGLANIASGFFGGLPATGVFVRASLNVKTHATHRTSQGLNSIFVAIISLLFLNAFAYIPMAAIAAILIFASIRMIEVSHLKRLYHFDKAGFSIAMVVIVLSVYHDALIGILAGTVVSLILLSERLSKGQFELVVNDKDMKITDRILDHNLPIESIPRDAPLLVYSIKGQLTYTNAQAHVERFEKKMGGAGIIIFRLRELSYIDLDGIDALEEIITHSNNAGKRVIITGITPFIASKLKYCKAYGKIADKHDVFDRTHHALNAIGCIIS
jgi:SulP family sulfate permease